MHLPKNNHSYGTFNVHYYLFLRCDGGTVKALPWFPRDPVCGATSEEPAVHAASDRVTLEGGSGSGHLPTGLSSGSQNTCRTYSTEHVHSLMNKCTQKNGKEYSCV
jgi:spore coat protein CotH